MEAGKERLTRDTVRDATQQEYAQLWGRIERYGGQYGRDTSRITKAIVLYYCLSRSSEEAWAIARETLTKRYGVKANLHDDDRYAFGTARDCANTIERFLKVGVTHFVVNTCRPLSEVLDQVKRLAKEIVPCFQ